MPTRRRRPEDADVGSPGGVSPPPPPVQGPAGRVDAEVMTSATLTGRHRAADRDMDTERIATLAEADRAGRHAEADGDYPIYDRLRDELAAVDWFSLGA